MSFNKISVKNGNLTVSGKLSQSPTASSARVTLLGLRTTTVKLNNTKRAKHRAPVTPHSRGLRRSDSAR